MTFFLALLLQLDVELNLGAVHAIVVVEADMVNRGALAKEVNAEEFTELTASSQCHHDQNMGPGRATRRRWPFELNNLGRNHRDGLFESADRRCCALGAASSSCSEAIASTSSASSSSGEAAASRSGSRAVSRFVGADACSSSSACSGKSGVVEK